MKVFARKTKFIEANIKYLRIVVPIDHDDEYMPYDYPFRNNNQWDVMIDIDTGQIKDWPKDYNKSLELSLKVRDAGLYWLYLTEEYESIVAKRESQYVPHCCGSDDYIEFNIGEQGFIHNWNFDTKYIDDFNFSFSR